MPLSAMPFRSFACSDLTPAECYEILVTAVTPRPIALVSTISKSGVANLAPFSYFNLGGNNPPSVMISPTLSPSGTDKDTLANIKSTEEFVVNIVTRQMVEQMNITSAKLGPEESEWQLTCFTAIESTMVRPSRVAESPLHMECRLYQIVEHGDGPSAANYVIGEVVKFHIQEDHLDGKSLNLQKLATVGRMGGDLYVDTSVPELFRLPRPR